MSSAVTILLATYNGARYLPAQIASIQAQSFEDWELLVRDDGSTDGTNELVSELAANDRRIRLLPARTDAARGPAANFNALLQASMAGSGRVFFLCDQDDVWGHYKLERQLAEFPERGWEQRPLLVHSDLQVVGQDLQLIDKSLIRHMALVPRVSAQLDYLLSRNYVTGCATACNRALLELALPIPPAAIMHDWWLALVAAVCGDIRYLEETLLLYRQHGANSIGAKSIWYGLNPTRNWRRGWQAGNEEFRATFDQALALLDRLRELPTVDAEALAKVATYARMLQLSKSRRLQAASGLQLRQGNPLLQAIYYIRLLTVPPGPNPSPR